MARSDFSAIRVIGSCHLPPKAQPVLLVANHVSWWDGMLLLLLQRLILPAVPLYTVMLAREFYQTFWFRWIGCLPITPGDISSVRHLLKKLKFLRAEQPPASMVCCIFPQGEIKPSFLQPLGFKPGVASVAAALAPVTIIPIGIHIEPMTRRKPEALLVLAYPIEHSQGALGVAVCEAGVASALDRLFAAFKLYGEHVFDEPNRLPHVNLL